MIPHIAGTAALVIWLYLVFARGGFWRMREAVLPAKPPSPPPRVAVVVPARNEADVIGCAVASLAAQRYPAPFHIVVVDDQSTDGTAESAGDASPAAVTVLRGAPLPPGWTGKLWAVHQGVQDAARSAPDYFLLTDADIVHDPANLSSLVAQAAAGPYDLVSLMASLHCRSLAERALIPAFVFFFFLLYPPGWIQSRRFRTAGAAGGCLLIGRDTLERIGGIERIRGELIDDCALARAVKRGGGRVWLGLHGSTKSIREYRTFSDVSRMISRTAFTQLRYSWWLVMLTAAGLLLTYLAPPVLALSGSIPAAVAWLLMCVAYLPALRFYRQSLFWAPLLPAVALFYLAATLQSAVAYQRGSGGAWKGRVQATRK